MTTWHLVPTGISILQGKTPPQQGTLASKFDNGDEQAKLHDRYKPLSDISAERQGLIKAGLDTATNKVIFLVSDTTDGLLAAKLNAVACAADFTSATYGTMIPNSPVVVLTIKDLTPNDEIKFRAGMATLARFFRQFEPRVSDTDEVIVHLSGGFKATIPYLIKLTELLQSKLVERAQSTPPRTVPKLTSRIQWEGAPHDLPVPLQRIDLGHLWRELYGHLVHGERKLFGHGYLYFGTDRENLTELGQAVAEFLPGPPSP